MSWLGKKFPAPVGESIDVEELPGSRMNTDAEFNSQANDSFLRRRYACTPPTEESQDSEMILMWICVTEVLTGDQASSSYTASTPSRP
jgi:hypothetical protein